MNVPEIIQGFDPIVWAIPYFTISVFMEMWITKRGQKGRFETKDSFASLVMGVGNNVSTLVFTGILMVWYFFVYEHRLITLDFSWWVWILAFILYDFMYYWSHRLAHTVRWFWADHVVHHSSQHYNLTTALRQPWLSPFTLKFMWLGSVLIITGFHPVMLAIVGSLNLIYQFWIHTETIDKCPPWFEEVMNTPSHHRVHHGTNPLYLDRNYAGVFIIWDKIFGTFQPERVEETPRYGIIKNLGTHNPLVIATHEWFAIIDDMRKAKSLRDAAMYLLAPPGWSPDGSRMTSKQILKRWEDRQAGVDSGEGTEHPQSAAE
jgi:sterol desaturase/sphingolipid hydroxylase (fatty acid hydroxylase superfamily)